MNKRGLSGNRFQLWFVDTIFTDPMEDRFQVMKTQKKERVAKNELQRLRNIQRAHKV